MMMEPVSGSWNLAKIFFPFESSGVFALEEAAEIFRELFFMV